MTATTERGGGEEDAKAASAGEGHAKSIVTLKASAFFSRTNATAADSESPILWLNLDETNIGA